MIEVPTLTTARFTLRPLQPSDAAALYPTLSDPDHCRYLSHPPFESEAQLWGWLAEPDWPGRSWIAQDAQDAVAGRFVAVPGHAPGLIEIGYIVCMDRQGQGIARECTEALIAHLFTLPVEQGGARKLTAEVDVRNEPSVRLLERLGFTREATLREHDATHIGLCDVYWYGLLAREWG
ncbi:MAG: GNAT family protein [Pseudomonadota bacterium]